MGPPREGLGTFYRSLVGFLSPEPIFSNLNRFFSMVTRGITFDWRSEYLGGIVTARFAGPDLPDAALHVLRGSLLFAFESTATEGKVGAPDKISSAPAETVVLYRVEWR